MSERGGYSSSFIFIQGFVFHVMSEKTQFERQFYVISIIPTNLFTNLPSKINNNN